MPVLAFVFIECTVGKAKDVAKKIGKIGGVRISHAVTGAYDAIALIEAPDVNALGTTVVSKIQGVPGVLRTSTNVVVE
ncbi:MAG: Lrp/AsnC ligand binding domain-containing protein [candidate division NC10 bacterium]|nr:Lrp/AsnC ligand binding domain-containing protein [candidate division NC10 bacterium]